MVEIQQEFKKIRPPTFDGEFGEITEAWLLIMTKYLYIYNYHEDLKSQLSLYK